MTSANLLNCIDLFLIIIDLMLHANVNAVFYILYGLVKRADPKVHAVFFKLLLVMQHFDWFEFLDIL